MHRFHSRRFHQRSAVSTERVLCYVLAVFIKCVFFLLVSHLIFSCVFLYFFVTSACQPVDLLGSFQQNLSKRASLFEHGVPLSIIFYPLATLYNHQFSLEIS